MIAENMDGVICISINRDSVLSGNSCKDIPDELIVDFEKKLRAKYSTLSAEDVNTWNWVKIGDIKEYSYLTHYCTVVTGTKLVRGHTVSHSISTQRLSLSEDTVTIITNRNKEVSVVFETITLV